MRRGGLLFLALWLGLATMATAQSSPEQNTEKYQAKIQEAWFVDAGWTDDYDTARKQAADSGKLIVGYFLRSYSF